MSPVNDLVIKSTDKNNDLVVATHGRSFWMLDDITPLEQYQDSDSAAGSAPVHAAPQPTTPSSHPSILQRARNVGKNPPGGAVIDYWLKTSLKSPIRTSRD